MMSASDVNSGSWVAPGAMDDSFSTTERIAIARSAASVLFTGDARESEAVARRFHAASGWRHGRFVVVDCTQPPDVIKPALIELLPADTGLLPDGPPWLRLSQDGTVFLREVNALPAPVQAWLADWLERLRRPGRNATPRRVMASSSEPLLERVQEGTFDDRLYYRLNVIHLVLSEGYDE